MGKASSAKKVARAARAGGSRRAGQRRALGFPVTIGAVVVIGLLLVFFARDKRNADAFPRANEDHVHSALDIYTCVTDPATTDPATEAPSTTQANASDVHGEFQPAPQDVGEDALGIHSHGDGLIHIHPFTDSAAGRKATLGIFLDQVGISMTNDTLTLPSGTTFTEGTTKCEGGKDGQLQVAEWNQVENAAKGDKPNQIFTDNFDKIRLNQNQAFTIAFMPAGSTIPAKPDVAQRIATVTDLAPSTTAPSEGATSTTSPAAPASGAPASGDPNATTTTGVTSTTAALSSTFSSGP
jgi:hypothetical protein